MDRHLVVNPHVLVVVLVLCDAFIMYSSGTAVATQKRYTVEPSLNDVTATVLSTRPFVTVQQCAMQCLVEAGCDDVRLSGSQSESSQTQCQLLRATVPGFKPKIYLKGIVFVCSILHMQINVRTACKDYLN